MTQICRLFALSSIEGNIGFYLTEKILSSDQGKAIGDISRSATAKLGTYALDLVKAFAIPDEIIYAPIANDWVKYNEGDNQGEIVLKHQYQRYSSKI